MGAAIAVLRERESGERRVAATPDSVKRLAALGAQVVVEAGAGAAAAYPDADYAAAGARIAPSAAEALAGADLLFAVRTPAAEAASAVPPSAVVVALLDPHTRRAELDALAGRGVSAIAMEFVPRITRAQAMDALSSQANLAGYRAVIEGARLYGRAFPMMMTAAGTVPAAKVFVMGAGVAGLQAIATARRLGAVVSATDVRPASKEQVESLGAKFVAVMDDEFKAAETAAGYAKAMSAQYQEKQAALVGEHLRKQDVVVTTALIPGRPAPRLVTAAQVAAMRAGSVLVDLAVAQGGNVEGARPGEVVETEGGARILGLGDAVAGVAADASALYARNLVSLASLLLDKEGALAPQWDDEILKAAVVVRGGAVVHPQLTGAV
ncbi:MAG: Re/Si-specific NAD(P)(+) transhydrogenase subunit alpha [Caulobacteraceae bacterium]|nr:Re/Si-specific NAD(P)(+) transhydrogenase subunit alpha [Caulobacter sp.]